MNVWGDERLILGRGWWMSEVMNVRGDECLRWWMSEVMNVRGDECLILGRGWWMSEVMNVLGDECRGDECRTIDMMLLKLSDFIHVLAVQWWTITWTIPLFWLGLMWGRIVGQAVGGLQEERWDGGQRGLGQDISEIFYDGILGPWFIFFGLFLSKLKKVEKDIVYCFALQC